jgi:hypothetical protein
LTEIDDSLVEDIHYSILFYGGRLLSHLSPLDDEIEDFISLRLINRHLAIVMDSDKAHSRDSVNATKKRVRDGFKKAPGMAWITRGREIENYVPLDLLLDAVRAIHPKAISLNARSEYDQATMYRAARSTKLHPIDKVKVAHEVASRPADLSRLDLRVRVSELCEFIRRANP